MVLNIGNNPVYLEIREVGEQQALLNLPIVNDNGLNFLRWTRGCTDWILSSVQMPLMSSMTWQKQQWDSAAVSPVSKAATSISRACTRSDGIADDECGSFRELL